MDYKEYASEDKKDVDLKKLKVGFIPKEEYIKSHENTVIFCIDMMIWYNGGFLLVQRDNVPAKGELWGIGGRVERGVPTEEGLKNKVRAECNLELENVKLLTVSRQFWQTDPFSHGKGTDTVSLMYYAEGLGELRLDKLHSNPVIVDIKKFRQIKDSLHPYMADFMELAFKQKL